MGAGWGVSRPRATRSSRGSVTEQEPNEVNQRRAEPMSVAASASPSRWRRASAASATEPPSQSAWVATRTLRKPCMPPPSGSWRTARCRPAVPLNGVSRSRAASIQEATVASSGTRSWSTWPSRSLSRRSAAATSSAAASQAGVDRSGDLDVDAYVVGERALVAGVVERGDHPADVAGAGRRGRAARSRARPPRGPAGRRHRAGRRPARRRRSPRPTAARRSRGPAAGRCP